MPIAEQLLYGFETETSENRTILAHSPGLGRSVAAEIRQLCEGWGEVPTGGLAREALLSVPLKKTMASLPGRLFAVLSARNPAPATMAFPKIVKDGGSNLKRVPAMPARRSRSKRRA